MKIRNSKLSNFTFCSVVLDLCVTARPVRLGHVIYPLIEGLTYTTFTLIYWALGGTGPGGSSWIYPMLDWGKPALVSLTVLGCAAGNLVDSIII